MPHVFKWSVCALGMSQQRQKGSWNTEHLLKWSQHTHNCDILLLSFSMSLSLSGYLHLIVSITLSLSLCLSFSLTQNTQTQTYNVAMTAVAITLVSCESPNSQAQGEDSRDLTVGISHNKSGKRSLAHPSSIAGADECARKHTRYVTQRYCFVFSFHHYRRQWRVWNFGTTFDQKAETFCSLPPS